MKNRQMSSTEDRDTWGWLVTTAEPVRMLSLRSAFTVTRNPSSCDLFFDQMFDELGDEDYIRISRRHFKIEKQVREECRRYRPMERRIWDMVSSAAKSLVRKLLDVNPEPRWSTGQVLAHRCFIEDKAAVNAAKAVMFHNFEENENSDEMR